MKLSIVIHDGVTFLDAIGAHEVVWRILGMEGEWITATEQERRAAI